MDLSRKNNINRGNRGNRGKLLRGGEGLKDSFKGIFKMTTYRYLFSILLIISCLLWAFATIIFVNARINLYKTTNDNSKEYDYKKLIDANMFEYLKISNFMVVDKFFLNANSKLKPPSILFWTLIGIMLGTIIFICLHMYILYDDPELKQFHSDLKNNWPYIIIATFPYLFILIIVIWFNTIQVKSMDNLDSIDNDNKEYNNFITIRKMYTKNNLQTIKKEIQKKIYDDDVYMTNTAIDGYFKNYEFVPPQAPLASLPTAPSPPPATGTTIAALSASVSTSSTTSPTSPTSPSPQDNYGIPIDIEAIFIIYKQNSLVLIKDDNLYNKKQYQRRFINYIDEYFDLLEYNGNNKTNYSQFDYYTKFYLLGLIEFNKDNIPETGETPTDKYKVYVAVRRELKKKLIDNIRSEISSYFQAIFWLYVILCIFILILLLMYNHTIKKPFINIIFIINKFIPINSLLIILGTILLIVAVVACLIGLIYLLKFGIDYFISARQ
jgi:hypothetical protein